MSTRWPGVCAQLLTWIVALAFANACAKSRQDPAKAQPSATYTVKGVVKMLPPAAQPGNNKTIVVLHQSVPKFRDREGQEVGMMAMPMPFTLAEGVDMTGITVGSKVEFTFGVFWQAPTPTQILSIKKLPDETQIDFSGE